MLDIESSCFIYIDLGKLVLKDLFEEDISKLSAEVTDSNTRFLFVLYF